MFAVVAGLTIEGKMVFWSRIRHLKLEGLSHQCKRWNSQISGVFSTYYIAGKTTTRVFEKPNPFACRRPTDVYSSVRSFAAPVQVKPKPEPKNTGGPRLNNQITADEVRLVSFKGEHEIVSRREALDRARKDNLDLVEVQRNAKPPVCRLMDFHKERYEQQLKNQTKAKEKSEVTLRNGPSKEVRFKGKTEQKDLQMKADSVKRLMEKGYRVKCTAMGTEDQDLGGLLSRLSSMIEDVSVVESGPMVERTKAYIVVRHIKFGPAKKNAKKNDNAKNNDKSKNFDFVTEDTSSTIVDTLSHIRSPHEIEENWELESVSGLEDEIIPDQAKSPIAMKRTDGKLGESKMGWSSFDASEDGFEKVFDVDGKSFTGGRMDFGQVPTSQFSDKHKPPPTNSARPSSPSLEQKQQFGNSPSTFRTFKQPPPVADETRVHEHSRRGSPTSPSQTPTPTPSPSYGIFSAPKPTNPPNR